MFHTQHILFKFQFSEPVTLRLLMPMKLKKRPNMTVLTNEKMVTITVSHKSECTPHIFKNILYLLKAQHLDTM